MGAFKRVPHGEMEILSGEKTAEDYLRMQQAMGRLYLKGFLASLAGLNKSGDFLEIGSGPGYQTAQVAGQHPAARIQVLEPSPDMVNIAEEYIRQQGAGDRVRFACGVVEDGPTMRALGQFDLVYSTFSLHHWKDPLVGLGNIHLALKPGGVALIYDFTRNRLMYWLTSFRQGIAESVRASYTKDEVRDMMERLGIKTFEVGGGFPYLKLFIHQAASQPG